MKTSRFSTWAVAAVLLLALTLSSCGQNRDTDSGNGTGSGGTTEMSTDDMSASGDTTDSMMAADTTSNLD
ncbi:hypothetical protein ACFPAF_01600 [Hymenobacter endophyticus]|uniref:Uncharacterized protein n=1 Tax=Hymenobacter endophyticus TaxID=3076335 RepID=A0ABU3TCJ5_9BACT|nr:hypothetical protein [Hymenobacter endophyticus]MDU0369072.1 hypothetical protein [Hymenobacter endophyticus]